MFFGGLLERRIEEETEKRKWLSLIYLCSFASFTPSTWCVINAGQNACWISMLGIAHMPWG